MLALAVGASAQKKSSFIEVDAGYDLHEINMKVSTGKKMNKGGLMLYGGFGHNFANRWGFAAGLRYNGLESAIKHDFIDYLHEVEDPELLLDDQRRDIEVEYSSLKEETKETVLSLPIAASYRLPLGQRLMLEARANIAPGVVLSQEFKTVSGEISVAYSYHSSFKGAEVEVDRVDELIGHGSNRRTGFSGDTDLKKFFVSAGADVYLVYPISRSLAISAGVYGSYTLTDQKNGSSLHIFDGETFVGTSQSDVCSKIHPYNFGVSAGLRYYFGLRRPNTPIDRRPPKLSSRYVDPLWIYFRPKR